jgi:hypothetical protein
MAYHSFPNLIQSLSDKNSLSQDINEISSMIYGHLARKYLVPIEQEIRCCNSECASTPTAEITLLEALKPFVSSTDTIDSLISAINYSRTIERLSGTAETQSDVYAQTEDSAIHKDGIYELDTDCIKPQAITTQKSLSLTALLLILILLSIQQ